MGFVAGMFVGGFISMAAMAIVRAGALADERAEQMRREYILSRMVTDMEPEGDTVADEPQYEEDGE